jgi:hypothetical protein
MTLHLRTSSKQGILQPSRLDIRILCERQANFKKNFSVFAHFFEKKEKEIGKSATLFYPSFLFYHSTHKNNAQRTRRDASAGSTARLNAQKRRP